jgi:hypothetical protein
MCLLQQARVKAMGILGPLDGGSDDETWTLKSSGRACSSEITPSQVD